MSWFINSYGQAIIYAIVAALAFIFLVLSFYVSYKARKKR